MADFIINVRVNNTGAAAASRQVSQQLTGLERTAANLQRVFVTLFAFQRVRQFAQAITAAASEFNQLERASRLAAGPTGDANAALNNIIGTAQAAGVELAAVATTYQRFALAGRAAGLETQQVNEIVDTLTRGFAVFSTSGAEASSALTQISQAFASGRLAGDEFRSVAENFPPLLRAISEVTGIATGDLRDFAAEGGITADVLVQAIGLLNGQIRELEELAGRSLPQALQTFSNELTLLVGNIDNAIGATEGFQAVVERFSDGLEDVRIDIFGGSVEELRERLGELQAQTEAVTQAADEQNPVIAALFGAYSDLEDNTEAVALAQLRLNQAFSEQATATEGAIFAAAGLETGQAALNATVGEFNTIQQLTQQQTNLTTISIEGLDAELVELGASFAEVEAQGERLAGTFDFLSRNTAASQRELARVDETVAALPGIFREFEAETTRLVAAQQALDSALASLIGRFAELLGVSGGELTNAFQNLGTLIGIDLPSAFGNFADSAAAALNIDTTTLINGLSGVTGILSALGVEFEDVIGRRGVQAIQLLGAVTSTEFQAIGSTIGGAATAIGDLFGGGGGGAGGAGGGGGVGGLLGSVATSIGSLFGGAEATVSSFGASSIGTLTSFNSSIGDLQSASAAAAATSTELGVAVNGVGTAAGASLANVVATAAAASGIAASIANIVGASEGAQTGAALGGAAGAVLGSFFGPGGAIIGGAVGGAGGGLLGSLFAGGGDGPDSAEAQQLRDVGRQVGDLIREGASISLAGVLGELLAVDVESVDTNAAEALFEDLAISVGAFNEALVNTGVTIETALRNRGANATEFRDFAVDALEALADSAGTAADAVSDAFNLSLVDTLAVFNALPPGVADSFAAIEQNAQQIAEVISLQFGISVEEVLASLNTLSENAAGAFTNIADAGDFVAASLSDRFGVSLAVTTALVETFPDSFITSFASIATNADDIARRIAVSFGLSFEEARALVLEFAGNAGQGIADVGETAADVANQIVDGFSVSGEAVNAIFLRLAQGGAASFDQVRLDSDGAFTFVRDSAQANLEAVVAEFGGTEADIQTLLGLLAGNADISFGDILTSGVFNFGELSADGIRNLTAILASIGITAEQASQAFGGISGDGVTAFNEIEAVAAVTTTNILAGFGLAETEITGALAAIADSGETSFSDIQGASGIALSLILQEFGVTVDQVRFLFGELSQGASSQFNDIANFGGVASADIQAVFSQAIQFVQTLFGNLGGAASGVLGGIAGAASATGGQIAGAFSSAAGSAIGSLNSINSRANQARAAINALANAQRNAVGGEFARGGVITGPIGIGGAGAGRAFQFGGVLDGLSPLFGGGGGITPTSNLGIAGEAGPEAILPLTQTSNGLGVTTVLPPELLAVLSNAANTNTEPTIIRDTRIFIVNDASRDEIDELRRGLDDIDGSVESRAEVVITDILDEVA